jgi:misacylated tRNA(Ala) deacylase
MTKKMFLTDSYLKTLEAEVISITESGGLIFDKSIFYPTSGGQPGDSGTLTFSNGTTCNIESTVKGEADHIVLLPRKDSDLPKIGETCIQVLDWNKRYFYMRMHTALHLLSVVIPLPVTGGQITFEKGRLDFDMPNPPDDKLVLEKEINDLIIQDFPISEKWISDKELLKNPSLVKTMSVKPPMGTGKIRLVKIGSDEYLVDLQPCGGTHVKITSEIGNVTFGKIEKKGKQNRRISIFISN